MSDSLQAVERARPSEKDERRALTWLADVRANEGPLERVFAASIIETLAWFEAALADTERERRLLAEELRIREQSQIPVIPRAAKARLDAVEARAAELQARLAVAEAYIPARDMEDYRGDASRVASVVKDQS